jgi:hypothetical protein
MNRITLASTAALGAVLAAACVPSQYGYGNYGGYSPYGRTSPYGQQYPYGSPYGQQSPYGSTFRCESEDHRIRRCNVDTRSGARLVRQMSDAPCVQGRTWGYDRDGVWVSGGCRGEFTLGGGGYGYGGYDGDRYGYGDSRVVRCESQDERRNTCGLPFRARSVTLRRQLSDTRCQQGYNWGWSADRIWVDRGCRAEFVVSG